MFVTSNVYLNIMFLHIACGFEILHNPFKQTLTQPIFDMLFRTYVWSVST